jgi:DNA polymerase-3 subunit gamma/tau
MTYQVLARKWRPKDFASLVGQEHVVRALTHALEGARLHHAYLFTGTRGVGKTTLSRIFAKALNCETGITAAPCGVCRACREIDEGRFIDYVEMDAASNRGVDEMAALLERAVYAPVDARFKVYMIDEVHMLTNHAFNAMLKTLEEPPPHIKFILATTDPQKIPVTVLSRCLQFNLKQMPAGHIVGHLERILAAEQIAFEPQALRLLARAAEGSMRDALSLTDQAIAYSANQVSEEAVRGMLGALDQSYLVRLVDALAAGDGALVLAIADEMALRSLSFSTALQDLAGLLHRIAWAQFAPSSVLDEWPEADDIRRFAGVLSPEHVQLFYQIATIGRNELGLAPDEYAGFTMTLLRMLAFEPARQGGPAAAAGPRTGGLPVSSRVADRVGAPRGGAVASSEPQLTAAAPRPAGSGRTSPGAAPARATEIDESAGARMPAREATAASMRASVAQEAERSVMTATPRPEAAAGAMPANIPGNPIDKASADDVRHEPHSATSAADAVLGEGRGAAVTDGTSSARNAVSSSAERVSLDRSSTADAASRIPSGQGGAAMASNAMQQPTAEVNASSPVDRAGAADVTSRSGSSTPARATEAAPPPRTGGASAALEVLRSAGMRVSAGRGAAAGGTTKAPPAPAAPAKQAVPPSPVAVPVPRPRGGEGSAPATSAVTSQMTPPPWDDAPPIDIPFDDYVPLSSEDDYFIASDDDFLPPPERAGGQAPIAAQAADASPSIDLSTLPPSISLDAVGFAGDWPALAAELGLSGVAHQLAFNSELTVLEDGLLTLSVPVPQYAEGAQVAKLKAALVERLGKPVEVRVQVGPARRTAAVLEAAARAQRQRQAEQEIDADPFVRSLIREFGATIVTGSVKPLSLSSDTEAGAS